jgi:hypothetical protein
MESQIQLLNKISNFVLNTNLFEFQRLFYPTKTHKDEFVQEKYNDFKHSFMTYWKMLSNDDKNKFLNNLH